MIQENLDSYFFKSKELNFEDAVSFINSPLPFINLLPKDSLRVTIQVQNNNIFEESINFNQFDFDKIKDEMNKAINIDDHRTDIEDFNCVVVYQIKKNDSLDTFSIYDFKHFMKYLQNPTDSKTLMNLLNLFKKFSSNKNKVYFNNHESFVLETNLFTTKSFGVAKEVTNEQRDNKYEAWNFFSNNQNLVDYNLLPEDFINNNVAIYESTDIQNFQLIFNKISIFLILSFLVDFVRLDDDTLTLRINERYRRFKENIHFKNTTIDNEHILKKIYEWVFFSSKNEIEDRLEITKNVLSRKLTLENNELILKTDSYYAIIDAHKIYLKENVTQYFEVKKEVAGMITEITSKSSDMIKNLSSTFKFQSGTLISYFISLFIFNSLSGGKFEVFNKSNYLISISLLAFSVGSLILALKQNKLEQDLLEDHFNSIKENYREDFDDEHLDELFNTSLLTSAKQKMEYSKVLFKWAWLIEIIGLFILITLIVFYSDLITYFKSIFSN